MYANTTNNSLRNTKGIKINEHDGYVWIAYWNVNGMPIEPFIRCEDNNFVVNE